MKVKLGAFPITFFTVQCLQHHCPVGVDIRESKDPSERHIIGAQIIALECKEEESLPRQTAQTPGRSPFLAQAT